jgi:hypothetical protein
VNRSQVRWLLVVAGVLLWVLAVYLGYYVVHKPFTTANLRGLANVAADLLTWRLTRRLSYHSLLEEFVFSAGLGLICFSVLTFGLGLASLLYRWLFWMLLIGGGLLLWREFRDLGRALSQVRWPRPQGRWAIFLSLFIAVMLLTMLPISMIPPTNWDSLVHHLVSPERYLQAHRFTVEFDNYLLFSPSFMEMLFTAAMALKSDVIPRLVHLSYLLLTLGAMGAFAARYWERRLGLLAVALFLSIPTAVQISTWAYVDFALVFYSFAAIYALLNWLSLEDPRTEHGQVESPSSGWLIVAGLSCGASANVKYNGLISPFILGTILIWALLRHRLPIRRLLFGMLVVAFLTLVVAAPCYIKNIVVTGNPIYPTGWGGRGWNEIAARWLEPVGPKTSLSELIVLPWRLTVLGQQGTVVYDATLSPLFLALLPLLLLVNRKVAGLGELLLAAAVGYALWIAGGLIATRGLFLNARWLLPICVPLSLVCACTLDGLRTWDRENFSMRRVLMMLVGLTLALAWLSQALLAVGLNPWPYLTGSQSRDDYQNQYISQQFHQAITYLNENLTEQERVLFFWEPRSYGCHVPHKADVLFDNFSQYLARYGSPENLVAGLRSEGFTHTLVNEYVYPWIVRDFPITPEEQASWEEFVARYLSVETLLHAEGEYLLLYRLPTEEGP